MKGKTKRVNRKACREQLENLKLCFELFRVIRRYFPELIERLKAISDSRHSSYIRYKNHVLLMTRIPSAIFYISSMRKM